MRWTQTLFLTFLLVACGESHEGGDAGADAGFSDAALSDAGSPTCMPSSGDACAPGATETVACGNCGTRTRSCTDACSWDEGRCEMEGCMPGETGYRTDGCAAGEWRAVSCDDACTFVEVVECAPLAPGPHIVIPYMGDPEPARLGLEFRTSVALADIYFLFDRTGSMIDEIASLRASVVSILDSRSCADSGAACSSDGACGGTEVCSGITGTCIESPARTSCVANLWSGVGVYALDYENLLSLSGDPAMTESALAITPGAGVEELNEALLAVADPASVTSATGCSGPTATTIGCPSYRADARRIVIVFTDEDSDGTTTVTDAGAALAAAEITMIGIDSSSATSTAAGAALEALARESGSFASDGVTPYVYPGSGSAVVTAVQDALDDVLAGGTQRVTIEVEDLPGDTVDATVFVEAFEVDTTSPGCAPGPTEDTDGDGRDDTFTSVAPGARVCFELIAARNETVPSTRVPIAMSVIVRVLGDGALLDTRTVHFVVPPSTH